MARAGGNVSLHALLADNVPLFYRNPDTIFRGLDGGEFVTTFKQTLARLPSSESFRDSHMGEIIASIFAQQVLGLTMVYSKLSLTTAENENPKKMDLVLCDLREDPAPIILGEVKCSPKCDVPANHHTSCYPDLFNSLREYDRGDLEFDLAAANDHIRTMDRDQQSRIRAALKAHTASERKYAGFIIVDLRTKNDAEMQLLATRSSTKTFDVDAVCVEHFPEVATSVYTGLAQLREICSQVLNSTN